MLEGTEEQRTVGDLSGKCRCVALVCGEGNDAVFLVSVVGRTQPQPPHQVSGGE